MKALFICDWIIYKNENNKYYDITLKKEIIDRYKMFSDKLTIATRVVKINNTTQIQNYHELDSNVEIIELPNTLSFKGMIANYKKTKKLINNSVKNNDLIYLRLPSLHAILGYKEIKKKKTSYFVELGGCAWDSHWYHGFQGKLFAPYMYFMTKKIVKNSKFVSYVTKQFLQKRYPNKNNTNSVSNVILHNVDYKNLDKRHKKIMEFNNESVIKIGTIANLEVKYKGHADVFKAIKILKNKGYNIVYELIGAGSKDRLLNYAKRLNLENQILFKGVKTHSSVLEWLDTIDVYVQPSKQEGLPRAVIEAMSRGCPVIASRIAGIPELLQDQYLFKKGSPKSIESRLTLVLKYLSDSSKFNFEKSKEYLFEDLNRERILLLKSYYDSSKNYGDSK